MIKTIFFDFDGVLTTDPSGSYTTCTYIRQRIPDIPLEQILQCYRTHQPKLLLGKTTHVAILNDLSICIGKNINGTMLHEAFRSTPVNAKMMEVCQQLVKKYQLGIITDNSQERFDILKRQMRLPDTFSIIIVSGEAGMRKDREKIFSHALSLSKCSADECVFIDNNESNLVIPKKSGWKTIFYDDRKNDVAFLVQQLRDFGVAIDA